MDRRIEWLGLGAIASATGGSGMFDKLFEFIEKFGRLFRFFYVCHPYQGGVVLRLGNFNRLLKPGINWMWPFNIEEDIVCATVAETMMVGPQSLTTKDGKQVVVSSMVTFKIDDVKTYLLDIMGAARVIEDAMYGVVSEVIQKRTWEELTQTDIANELTKKSRVMARRYGVEIIRVQIGDLSTTRSLRLMQTVNNVYAPNKEI
jgi:regulator of protease activity HflC (stomatin/prohibitin superfamily)